MVTDATDTRASLASSTAGGRSRRSRRFLWVAAFVLVAAAAAGALSYGPLQGETEPPLMALTVAKGDIEQTVTALGALQPKEYVDVGTQVSGQFKRIHVAIGDTVQAGNLLAEIDPTVYESRVKADRARLRTLQAQLAEQQAQLALARQQDRRNRRLFKIDAVSEDVLQSGETAVKVAEAQITALEAQIDEARSTLAGDLANLGYTKIYAPMAGTVVSQSAREGQTLNASQSAPIIVRLADLDTMTVWAQVAEADIMKLTVGMPVYFTTLGMPERRWQATVRQILPTPEIINDVVLYNVLVDVDNSDRRLMTSMSVQVFFVLGEARDVALVPREALRRAPADLTGGPLGKVYAVEVLTEQGLIERQVRVGLMNRSSAEVLSGLAVGDRVVVATPQVPQRDPASNRTSSRGPRL